MDAGLPGSITSVDCFEFHGGALCAGTSGGVYRWDGVSWTEIVAAPNVLALASAGTDLYLGGRFTPAAGLAGADYVARWDGAATHAVGTGLGGDAANGFRSPGTYALAVLADGTVAVGTNNLTLADGDVSYGFARILPCAATSVEGTAPPAAGPSWEGLRLSSLRLGDGGAAFELLLPASADVTLAVYDVSGREVGSWEEANAAAGRRVVTLDGLVRGRFASSGVYFARLQARSGNDGVTRVARAVHVR
jgi:hypothetical protein